MWSTILVLLVRNKAKAVARWARKERKAVDLLCPIPTRCCQGNKVSFTDSSRWEERRHSRFRAGTGHVPILPRSRSARETTGTPVFVVSVLQQAFFEKVATNFASCHSFVILIARCFPPG